MRYILLTIFSCLFGAACTQQNQASTHKADHQYTNELVHETSPYLLQHAHNPVNWRAWNDETLALAKKENKLIIISIGYAACHWCHVMEHESFEDEEVAQLMNTHFIPVKIDREERPDIDDIYMTACNIILGRGGWPLNAIALPDTRPVFAGTYYPKDQWMNILQQMIKLKEENPQKLEDAATSITEGIKASDVIETPSNVAYDRSILDDIMDDYLSSIDYKNGGNDRTPRFPLPNNFELAMKYHWLSNSDKSKEAVDITLTQMAYGGIYDQLGGGFARYSVDGVWKVPHFEKMLYDNSQLLGLYADAYKVDKNPLYKRVIEETVGFCNRELLHTDGAYYSSLDADSEGEEGKFYVWNTKEIDSLLGADAKIYKSYYSITPRGNWEHTNILHITKTPEEVARLNKISVDNLQQIVSSCNEKLFAERSKRERPGTDDKILCSWNALMIDGLLRCHEATGDKSYYDSAIKTTRFILSEMKSEEGGLYRNYKNGKASINAFLDDYALLINALIKLYQNDFDPAWLQEAKSLSEYVIENFSNENQELFYYTSKKDSPLIVRKTEFADKEIPASNSIMANNLYQLGSLYYKKEWSDLAEQMLGRMQDQLTQESAGSYYSNWIQLYLSMVQPAYEIAVVGENAKAIRKELSSYYLGNSILLGDTKESELPLLKGKYMEGETMIYVCQNKTCKLPVTNVSKALKLIER